MLIKDATRGVVKGILYLYSMVIYHLLFIDDIMIFGQGIQEISNVIVRLEAWSLI